MWNFSKKSLQVNNPLFKAEFVPLPVGTEVEVLAVRHHSDCPRTHYCNVISEDPSGPKLVEPERRSLPQKESRSYCGQSGPQGAFRCCLFRDVEDEHPVDFPSSKISSQSRRLLQFVALPRGCQHFSTDPPPGASDEVILEHFGLSDVKTNPAEFLASDLDEYEKHDQRNFS